MHATGHGDPFSPWHSYSAWRMNEPHQHRLQLSYRDRDVDVTAEQLEEDRYRLHLDGRTIIATGELSGEQLSADIDGFRQKVAFAEHDGVWSAYHTGGAFRFGERQADLGDIEAAGSSGNPRAPMNGTIVQLIAEVGAKIEADAPLLVMEAMKMEYTIRAPAAGSVTRYFYQAGELVDGDAELLEFEAED